MKMENETPKIRALLADDHNVVRAGIRLFLEDGSIQVIAEAADGQTACRLISELMPDVAVIDIQMPGMSGIEVTRWIHANHLPVGVLILTAYDDEPYVRAVLQAGANGYVLKTADPHDILQAVKDVYARKPVLDPSMAQKLFSQLSGADLFQPISKLTEREVEVIELTASGGTNKAIGHQLGISERTVQNHLAKIFQKLNVQSRTEAVMKAISLGIIAPVNSDNSRH